MLYAPTNLHIPDGFLTIIVSLIFWLITIVMVGLAVSKTNKSLGEKQVPLMGVMAAFIFAAQMLNFPIAGGTSGHFLGGALAAIVLGPWAGILVMTAVVGVQGLLFQDGGLLVMGANIFNMGILTAVIGFGLYRLVVHQKRGVRLVVAGGGAWIATMAAALAASLQLWLSGTTRLEIVLPAMLGVHALIGVGEGLITVAALAYIEQTRPDLLNAEKTTREGGRGWIVGSVLVTLAAVLISPLASGSPDGLERVAENLGFLGSGQDAPYQILPDYTIPFLGETAVSTILAGVVGAVILMGLLILVGRNLRRRTEV
ncbi:MAG TPA: cobalamin biosynthesis protein CbiM [Chloroflexi bacterium]|nr:MAG: cobalamin biosynthesis protein CbiM [Chloroflexota bacterium]HDD54810.1 cobalamin biosynthesis protein CbiM [Chloroflexota bacterium]